mmetsp:Transcript_56377/g.138382  ORF Transcript_56377/g.138382 Transcript_56377/m.138382 type:complete len:224 (+) Transcript_56377:268-939(+)
MRDGGPLPRARPAPLGALRRGRRRGHRLRRVREAGRGGRPRGCRVRDAAARGGGSRWEYDAGRDGAHHARQRREDLAGRACQDRQLADRIRLWAVHVLRNHLRLCGHVPAQSPRLDAAHGKPLKLLCRIAVSHARWADAQGIQRSRDDRGCVGLARAALCGAFLPGALLQRRASQPDRPEHDPGAQQAHGGVPHDAAPHQEQHVQREPALQALCPQLLRGVVR